MAHFLNRKKKNKVKVVKAQVSQLPHHAWVQDSCPAIYPRFRRVSPKHLAQRAKSQFPNILSHPIMATSLLAQNGQSMEQERVHTDEGRGFHLEGLEQNTTLLRVVGTTLSIRRHPTY